MKKSEYIIKPEDIEWVSSADIKDRIIKRQYYQAINLPFWLEAFYETEWNYLALYGKDYEIIKIYLNNIQEANCIILWVIEWYRQIQSELFNLWIID